MNPVSQPLGVILLGVAFDGFDRDIATTDKKCMLLMQNVWHLRRIEEPGDVACQLGPISEEEVKRVDEHKGCILKDRNMNYICNFLHFRN
jgi:hypothetical protein